MDFGQKKIREIDLFDFTSFFCMDFFKFSGPMCNKVRRKTKLPNMKLANRNLGLSEY